MANTGRRYRCIETVPARENGQAVMKGRVEYTGDTMWDAAQNKAVEVKHLHVKYGIEDYFVPEGYRPRAGASKAG